MDFAIGIPAFNEEKNIASIILKLKKESDTIIVCDDGSSDLTAEIAEKLGAIVVKHEKNQGYGSAIKTIFLQAVKMNVDALVTFDADGQHRIQDIANVIEPIKNNKADIVIGSRFLENSDEIPKYRKIGIKAITGITNVTSGLKISDSQSGFRAYNKKILHQISMKYVSIERPLVFYGIPGTIFLCIGLFFSIWAIQIFAEQRDLITNIALIGGIGIILGTILIITATILHSIISVVRENR